MPKQTEKKIVMYDSPEAATPVQITGYRDIHGRVWIHEHWARYASATHDLCDCGKIKTLTYTKCGACAAKAVRERWEKLPLVEWDGKTPLADYDGDDFYFDVDDLLEKTDDMDPAYHDNIMLVTCTPDHGPVVDPSIFADHLPEDADSPDVRYPEIAQALDALNKAISDHGPYCWHPGKQRVDVRAIVAKYRAEEAADGQQ